MKYDLSFLELDLRELLKKLKKHNTYAMELENEIILYKQENARLKEENNILCSIANGEKEKVDKILELLNRISKAIENIKDYLCSYDYTSAEFKELAEVFIDLLNTLEGVDKE